MTSLLSYVDTSKPSLWIALLAIAFNPTAWNIVARNGEPSLRMHVEYFMNCDIAEYRNKTITHIFGGDARFGCYFLAIMIFAFGMVRDGLCVVYYRPSFSKQLTYKNQLSPGGRRPTSYPYFSWALRIPHCYSSLCHRPTICCDVYLGTWDYRYLLRRLLRHFDGPQGGGVPV